MRTERNSSFELLRIICIFGIISMHTFGAFYDSATGINLIYGTLINSVFNMGVSIFMLISGYFGIYFSSKKLIHLEVLILTYSIVGVVLEGIFTQSWSLIHLFKSFLPISTRKYWYMSVYMIILICSDYINRIPEKLDRDAFRRLILICVLFFYICPSFTYFEIVHDSGKGIVNMLCVYLIGRYIRFYHNDTKYKNSKIILYGVVIVIIGFILNYALSLLLGGEGVFAPFARDNSITIIAGSICVFMLFKNLTFYSKIINKIAGCVFATYLFEGSVRTVFNQFIVWDSYGEYWYLFAMIGIYVIVVMAICICFEGLRAPICSKCERFIYNMAMKLWNCLYRKIVKFLEKV